MAKDLTNLKEVLDGQLETIKQYLDQGYTVLVAIEKGTKAKIALQTGYSYLFKANVELKESKADAARSLPLWWTSRYLDLYVKRVMLRI